VEFQVKLVTLDPTATDYFEVVEDADGRLAHIDITLNTIAGPTRAANAIANPTRRLFTRVSQSAHER